MTMYLIKSNIFNIGLLAYFILLFLPESPKFVLAQGDKKGAYEILRKMHRINMGKSDEFEMFEIYEELESIENRKRILESRNSRFPLLTSVWIQTAPLFRPPHLFSTILVCSIQFGIYFTSNGFYMFFADILNRMATNLDNFIEPRISMCEVINMKSINRSVLQHINDSTVSEKVSHYLVIVQICGLVALIEISSFRFALQNLSLKLLSRA